ncbi:MAG: efflux RND transporter periplasmic adaptor subunit [Candidatus Sulfotelmatobacter sp.]
MKRRRVILWGVLAAILVGGVAVVAAARRSSVVASEGEIPVGLVKRGDMELKVVVTGELRATHTVTLAAPPVGGGALQITRLSHTGVPVKKGDIVIEFDPSEQRYKLDQNRSELLQADQEITKAKADAAVLAAQDKVALLKDRFDVRRAELDVQKNELVSAIDGKKNQLALEQAQRVLAELEQDIQSHTESGQATIYLAQEKRNKAKLAMDQAQQNIDKMHVPAAIDGLVSIEKNRDASGGFFFDGMTLPDYREGDQVEPGSSIAEVIDSREVEIVCKINERDRSNIKAGQPAEIEFDALPGQVFKGTVKTVGGMSIKQFWDTDMGGQFETTIQLANSDARLRPGLTAQVVIRGEEKKDALYVPRLALFLKDGKRVVYVKSGNGFEPHEVKIQSESESRTAIEGLNAGSEVALVDPTAPRKANSSGAPAAGIGGGTP